VLSPIKTVNGIIPLTINIIIMVTLEKVKKNHSKLFFYGKDYEDACEYKGFLLRAVEDAIARVSLTKYVLLVSRSTHSIVYNKYISGKSNKFFDFQLFMY